MLLGLVKVTFTIRNFHFPTYTSNQKYRPVIHRNSMENASKFNKNF